MNLMGDNLLLQAFAEQFPWLVPAMVALWIVGLLMLALIAYQKYSYLKRIKDSGIEQIDKMSGWEFEKFLQGLFEKRGYRVEHVGSRGSDYGADLVIEKDGVRTVVQAKRYKERVGIKAIQEVVSAKQKYSCTRALLATNSYLTKAAWELGVANHVSMWTRKRLIQEILKPNRKITINSHFL